MSQKVNLALLSGFLSSCDTIWGSRNRIVYEGYHKLAHFLFDHVFEHAFNFKLAHLFFPFQIRFLYGHVIFLQISPFSMM